MYFWRTYDQQEIDLVEETDERLNAYDTASTEVLPIRHQKTLAEKRLPFSRQPLF